MILTSRILIQHIAWSKVCKQLDVGIATPTQTIKLTQALNLDGQLAQLDSSFNKIQTPAPYSIIEVKYSKPLWSYRLCTGPEEHRDRVERFVCEASRGLVTVTPTTSSTTGGGREGPCQNYIRYVHGNLDHF